MTLIKILDGVSRVDDPWTHIGDTETLLDGPVIVSLARFEADRDELLAREGGLGIRLKSNETPHAIADYLGRIALVALEFPMFKDGRAYSYARLLRTRYGFTGELRAVGNVLRDQFFFMRRVGFDAFEVDKDADAAAFEDALGEFSHVYQPASDERRSVFHMRQARRLAAE